MSTLPQPILVLYSHGRNPPLNPPPDLKYDLRSIPNPPKAVRDVSDGRSKRLREHLLSNSIFISKLEAVEQEIRAAMASKVAVLESRDKATDCGSPRDSIPQSPKQEEQDIKIAAPSIGSPEETSLQEVVLRVGCSCALGHHRSVAFVQELALRAWPRDWQIHVIHRDVDKKRASGARSMQKAAWREKRGNNSRDRAD
ncbi:hypothetical protein CC78DRAFT_532329 [Lojkania enalia]|uniref:RapZ C-terminal domain-containing protein n=1 Tax=Lojkania enalia TaxID=147567 RepID=A0A9P4N548_9PLEO|nr:hypothetical protein CC78DRAFT_532329 [Didymosphaeria enalia]